MTKIERPGEPTVFSVESDDKEMNGAIKTAKSTIGTFIIAFNRKDPRHSDFFVKYAVEDSDHFEHVWLETIYADSQKVRGFVDNLPNTVKNIELGDTITIATNEITDWFFIDSADKKIFGAQTIRVLRERMTNEEQRQLDEELGGTIQ